MPNRELGEYAKRHFYKHYSTPLPSYIIRVNGKEWKSGYSSATRAFKIAAKVSRMNADKEYVVVDPRGNIVNRLINGVDQLQLDS